MKKIAALVLTVLTSLALPGVVLAEGFSVIDWSARGMSLAGGMVARANDASAVAYNPAGITQLPGVRFMLGTTIVSPMAEIDTTWLGQQTTTSIERKHWLMPHAYLTYQLSDRLWTGVGIFSRFGLGNGYSSDWPMSHSLTNVTLETITLNPNLAWKVSDKLSIAAGVEVTGAMMEMNRDYRPPVAPLRNSVTLDGSGAALSANIALRYAFNDAWSFGLTWRSRMALNVHGKVRWDNPVGGLMSNSDLHGTISLPDSFSAAVAWRATPKLSLEAGVVYMSWSNYRHLDIYLEEPTNAVQWGPKYWGDVWTFNISAEYQVRDWLALRAGYGYETSPLNSGYADYIVPASGRMYFNAGLGFNWKQWTLDLGYSYLIMKDLDFNAAARNKPQDIAPGKMHDGHANIVSVSLGYTF